MLASDTKNTQLQLRPHTHRALLVRALQSWGNTKPTRGGIGNSIGIGNLILHGSAISKQVSAFRQSKREEVTPGQFCSQLVSFLLLLFVTFSVIL